MSLSERIPHPHIGRRGECNPKTIEKTIRGFEERVKPVLQDRVESALVFTELDGAKEYPSIDNHGRSNGQKIPADAFLRVGYNFLDERLGRDPNNFAGVIDNTDENHPAMLASHPSKTNPDLVILSKHYFSIEDGTSRRDCVKHYLIRRNKTPKQPSFIRVTRQKTT